MTPSLNERFIGTKASSLNNRLSFCKKSICFEPGHNSRKIITDKLNKNNSCEAGLQTIAKSLNTQLIHTNFKANGLVKISACYTPSCFFIARFFGKKKKKYF